MTFASHLPMYHSPHDYQVFFILNFADVEGSSATVLYANAKKEGKTFFTLEPEVMYLTSLINGTKSNFQAYVYDGHFEKGGLNIGSVTVTVEKVVFTKKLHPNDTHSLPEEYLLIGDSGEFFAAHIITGKPNYDAILKISPP